MKGKKQNEEKLPFAKKRKTSREVPASVSSLSHGASSLLLKEGFISDLHLSHNVVDPVSKSENMRKPRTKEAAGKCSKPAKAVLDKQAKEDNAESNLITG